MIASPLSIRCHTRRQQRRQHRQEMTKWFLTISMLVYMFGVGNITFFASPAARSSTSLYHYHSDTTTTRRVLRSDKKGRKEKKREEKQALFRSATENHDFSSYSCEGLNDLTRSQDDGDDDDLSFDLQSISQETICDFARTCNDGDGIFAPIVYCSSNDENNSGSGSYFSRASIRTRMILISPPLILLMTLLFRILGSTAEEFFSPGLETFSLKLGLPERFAGVTLLALGNGAPDIASTVSAILQDKKRGYLMALGELTGAAMVSSTVIVGVVCYVSVDGVACRGALFRDILVFILTMVVVFFSFEDGSISTAEVHTFIAIYIAYVLVVLLSDIYHRAIVEPRFFSSSPVSLTRKTSESMEHRDESATITNPPNKNMEKETTPLMAKESEVTKAMAIGPSIRKSMHRIEQMIEAISNYDVESQLSESSSSNHETSTRKEESHHESGWGNRDDSGREPLMVFHPHHGGIVNLKDAEQLGKSETSLFETDKCLQEVLNNSPAAPESWKHAILSAHQELTAYCSKFVDETILNDEHTFIERFLMLCELPFTILRMATIPVPCDGYYCRPLVAISVAFAPVWMWYYLSESGMDADNDSFQTGTILAVVLFGTAGLCILRYAPCGEVPMRPSIAVPITLIGFVVSATQLDFIADHLVDLLSFFGIILHIPATIMGLTILAWGNASQDLVANMTVAKKGLSTMAITASFAGPVFNILIGLGIGLTILLGAEGEVESVSVSLNNALRTGFIFSIITGVLVIVSGICVGQGKIPKTFGYVSMTIYTLYVLASLIL